jgi:threonine synthase
LGPELEWNRGSLFRLLGGGKDFFIYRLRQGGRKKKMAGLLERYRKYFPITDDTPIETLGEGETPLVKLNKIGSELGVELYGKYEGANPTGSFKDRGMVLAMAKAAEGGAKAVICASTGNTSASAAAYAARFGLKCYVLLPAGKVALGKLSQALVYGAKVIAIRGNFDRALELARKASSEMGLAIVNSVNPYRLWGQRSGAWEVCDELGVSPDWMVLPVGNAGNITAYWTGFVQYKNEGKITKVPQMVGIQAQGASPLVSGESFPNPETVATAIRIGHPVNGKKAAWAVRMSGGFFSAVSDEEILLAQKELASKEGVFAEPASCAPLAGLKKAKREGKLPEGIKVVMVLTGNGLKDPQVILSGQEEICEIDGDESQLREVLSQ